MNGLILCTKECNLRCTYCFEESMHSGCMPTVDEIKENFAAFLDDGFEKFVVELIKINEKIGRSTDITFHGGEPMLIGVPLLRRAFEIVNKYDGTSISMQSNGTLLTDEMASLLKEYNVKVGISIDGPKEMHDAYRLNKGKKGSFDPVFNNIKKLIPIAQFLTILPSKCENSYVALSLKDQENELILQVMKSPAKQEPHRNW